jgi:hypothetical protein
VGWWRRFRGGEPPERAPERRSGVLSTAWAPAGRGRGGGTYDQGVAAQGAREEARARAAAKRCRAAQVASRRSLERAHVAVQRAYLAARRVDLYPESDVAIEVDGLLAATLRLEERAKRQARAVGRAVGARDPRGAERAASLVEATAETVRVTAGKADRVSRKAGD